MQIPWCCLFGKWQNRKFLHDVSSEPCTALYALHIGGGAGASTVIFLQFSARRGHDGCL
jgi:hypothetical protein